MKANSEDVLRSIVSMRSGLSLDDIRDVEAGLNPGDSEAFMPSHGSAPFVSGGKAHLARQGNRKGKRR